MFLLPPNAAITCLKHSVHRLSGKGTHTNCSGSCNTCLDVTLFAHNGDSLCSDEAERGLIGQQHAYTHTHTYIYIIWHSINFRLSQIQTIQAIITLRFRSAWLRTRHPASTVQFLITGFLMSPSNVISELFICCLCLWFSCSAAAVVTLQPTHKIFWLAKEVQYMMKENIRISRVSPEFIEMINCTRNATLNWYCHECFLLFNFVVFIWNWTVAKKCESGLRRSVLMSDLGIAYVFWTLVF